jgi:hypothetical protein
LTTYRISYTATNPVTGETRYNVFREKRMIRTYVSSRTALDVVSQDGSPGDTVVIDYGDGGEESVHTMVEAGGEE